MKILILGASGFIGRELLSKLKKKVTYDINVAGRSYVADTAFIKLDRNEAITKIEKTFDIVVDLSCYKFNFLTNTLPAINFKKYIFLSSMAVTHLLNLNCFDKIQDSRSLLIYAKEKLLCEEHIICNLADYTILRPGFVVGVNDPLDRFEYKDGEYIWKKSGVKLTQYIHIDALVALIEDCFFNNFRGIIPCTT